MSALTPPLHIVAARLQRGAAAPATGDPAAADPAGAGPWSERAIPAALAAAFERAAAAGALREQALAAGQIHALRDAPAFGAVLLDRWLPQAQQWQGWLVTPDPAYAGSTDLVLEARDGPFDPRAGMVCCALPLLAAPAQLGDCLGRLPPARLDAVRWLGECDRGAAAGNLPRPGVIARMGVPDGYALTGTPLAGENDARNAYRDLLAQGMDRFGLVPAKLATTHTTMPPAVPETAAPPPRAAANQPRWLRSFAAVAATLAVVQAGLLLWRFQDSGDALRTGDGAQQYRGGSSAEGMRFRVLFRPEASEAEIRDWLRQQKLQIVAGPDPMGAYTLSSAETGRALPQPGPGNPLARVEP